MHNKNSFYFVTKPLQYYNALNLSSIDRNDKYLFVIPNFGNADDFVAKIIKNDKRWIKVTIIKSKRDKALLNYTVNNEDNVYVHSDMHRELMFRGAFSKANVIVYEEGLGTYSKEITNITNSWWKNALIKFLTRIRVLNSVTGGHPRTKQVYVYDQKKFSYVNNANSKKCRPFESNFYDNYINNKFEFDAIFKLNEIEYPKHSRVALFLTSNDKSINFEHEFNKIDRSKYDEVIFKAHPNISNIYRNYECKYTNVMAELLIVKFLESESRVDVYHFGTAVELYIKSKNVNFIRL